MSNIPPSSLRGHVGRRVAAAAHRGPYRPASHRPGGDGSGRLSVWARLGRGPGGGHRGHRHRRDRDVRAGLRHRFPGGERPRPAAGDPPSPEPGGRPHRGQHHGRPHQLRGHGAGLHRGGGGRDLLRGRASPKPAPAPPGGVSHRAGAHRVLRPSGGHPVQTLVGPVWLPSRCVRGGGPPGGGASGIPTPTARRPRLRLGAAGPSGDRGGAGARSR